MTTAPDDPTRHGVVCALCLLPFTAAEWDQRHTGFDPLDEVHERCCETNGPCAKWAQGLAAPE